MAKKITIQFEGLADNKGNVRLNDFTDQLNLIRRALNARESFVSGNDSPQIVYKIVDLHHSAATVVLEPVALIDDAKEYVDKVVAGFSAELRVIKRKGKLTDEPDFHRLETYTRIGERSDNLISKVRISVGRENVTIDRAFRQNVEKILGPDEYVQGTISGMLEAVNFHNTNRFTLYPTLGPRKVQGTFDEILRGRVKEGIGNFVTVIGKLRYKQWSSFPHGVLAEEVETHEPDATLPRLSEMRGEFGGATGEKTSIEFVEHVRNEGW